MLSEAPPKRAPRLHSALAGRHSGETALASWRYDLRFMPTKVRELLSQLQADGWFQVRQSGSHRQFRHPSKIGTVTVAGKPSVEIPPGTLNSILKQAGLKEMSYSCST